MGPTWRVATAAGVTNSLEQHILPVLGRRPVASIRKADVEALCASMQLAASTVRTVHQHLGQVLGSAVEDGLVARNPATKARLPKLEAPKAQPVPLDVVERIRAALPAWMAVAVPIGIGAGQRQGEASGLTVDRVDFLRRTMRVDRQLVRLRAGTGPRPAEDGQLEPYDPARRLPGRRPRRSPAPVPGRAR